MDPEKTVSIVIPVYNEEAGIGAVCDAIIPADLHRRSEIIIVNDGSTDMGSIP
ncbi:MAG: glycosyltransferase [Chitinivibrionales bacterium]|nr:glycosyltransferase [Chitinivibrionales bacterium]